MSPYSRGHGREPASRPIRLRLAPYHFDRLSWVAQRLGKKRPGDRASGVAETVRLALDFFLGERNRGNHAQTMPRGTLTKSISVRLSASELAELEQTAGQMGYRNTSELLRDAVRFFLDHHTEAKRALKGQGKQIQCPDEGKNPC